MKKTSKRLGIIGIIAGLFSPIIGIILGVIGLSISKDEKHRDRDVILNISAIGVSIISWIVTIMLMNGY